MINLMIGTPMYGAQCSAHYTFSNLNLARVASSQNIDINYQFITTESLVTRARNDIARTFMQSNCSHLLFIDADIGFEPSDVVKLLNHDLDLVCGGYPAKTIDWNTIHHAANNGVRADFLQNYASPYIYNRVDGTPQVGDLIEVKEAGTGFMMIKRSVFEKLSNHLPFYTTNKFNGYGEKTIEYFSTSIEDGFLLSEDYFFCRKWRSIGGSVFVDSTIKLLHVGPYVFESSPQHWIR